MLLENKLNLLSEKINTSEFLLLEMKKIGIEKLPYAQSSLKRFIDSKTMDVHYNGHYKTYVKKLNDALSKKNYGDVELEDIIKKISKYDKTIRNNAGGAFNHALFWKMLSPTKKELPKEIKTKIIKDFGSYNDFKKEFTEVTKTIFGSGWAWLIITKSGKLKVMSTPNQDNPLMNVIEGGGFPILGLDTWEHAYYLKYQNKRDEYIKNFWDVVNWDFVNDLYLKKQQSKLMESIRTKKVITESIQVLKPNGLIDPRFYRELLPLVYPDCSPKKITTFDINDHKTSACLAEYDTKECKTGLGVVGGKFAAGQRGGTGDWSVINWFDGNTTVSSSIISLYKEKNEEGLELGDWIKQNIVDLIGEDGKYTSNFADSILNTEGTGTLNKGIEREGLAVKILNKKYKNLDILKFCDGDVRDKFYGQDMLVTAEYVNKHVQVKPTFDLYQSTDENGERIYVFKSKNIYKPNNIAVFAFIKNEQNYIFFNFDSTVDIIDNGDNTEKKYSYIFKPEHLKFTSPKIYLYTLPKSKINENHFINEDEGDEIPNLKSSKKKKKPLKTTFDVSQKTMRELIHSVYPKCSDVESSTNGCIGTIETENCVTNKGVIGGEFRESNYGGDSEWSLINRWDANKNIHKKILELYNNDDLSSEFGLEAWVTTKRFELFSNNGKYTPIIAEVGREFVAKGVSNENYAKNVIKELYNLKSNQEGVTWKIYTNCSGSINDTIYGQDIVLEFKNESLYFQVKPLTENDIKIVIDDRGEFYKVNSHFSHRKYKMNKVDVIIYVDSINQKYILFNNDYNYIQTILSDSYKFPFYINYYESPLSTNMNIEKVPLISLDKEDKKLLQKSKEEKIKLYKERIKYFKDKLKELGVSDDLIESIKKYQNKLIKLLTE